MRCLALFGALVVNLGMISLASACSCLSPPPPRTALEQSHAVFSGKVLSVEKDGDFGVAVTIEVASIWKGDLGKKVVVYTANNSAACGFEFKEGDSYLVYASTDEEAKDKRLTTGLCTRTKGLDAGKAEMEELPEPKAAK